MAETVTIDHPTTNKIKNLNSGGLRSIKMKIKFHFYLLEMEDVNFHYNSAVLLPDYGEKAPEPGTTEQNRITGLSVLYACYKHAVENPTQFLVIIGHTDKSGPHYSNLLLSQLRAQNVLFALIGNKKDWVEVSLIKHKNEDYKQILKWISYTKGWNCDPGEINNDSDIKMRVAIENFQTACNI